MSGGEAKKKTVSALQRQEEAAHEQGPADGRARQRPGALERVRPWPHTRPAAVPGAPAVLVRADGVPGRFGLSGAGAGPCEHARAVQGPSRPAASGVAEALQPLAGTDADPGGARDRSAQALPARGRALPGATPSLRAAFQPDRRAVQPWADAALGLAFARGLVR